MFWWPSLLLLLMTWRRLLLLLLLRLIYVHGQARPNRFAIRVVQPFLQHAVHALHLCWVCGQVNLAFHAVLLVDSQLGCQTCSGVATRGVRLASCVDSGHPSKVVERRARG